MKAESRFTELAARIDSRFAAFDGRIDALKAELDDLIEMGYRDLLKWSFVFWATTIIALFLRTR